MSQQIEIETYNTQLKNLKGQNKLWYIILKLGRTTNKGVHNS